jgi:hypothetical protein
MSEANLKLGAIVNLEDLKVGFDGAASTVQASVVEMGAAFKELSGISGAASKQMASDVTGAAAVISPAYQRIAEATVAYRQAQAAVRTASRDTIALAAGEAAAVDRLTLALQRQAAADAELSAAKKATATATAESAGAMGLFAEAFGPLLEGALILEYINHLKESTLETSHLAEASGLSVVDLVELKDSMDSLGVSTERLPQQLTKLAQNIAAAGGGSKESAHLFHQLGIETEDWKGKLPSSIDVLLQMSHHLKESTLSTSDLAAASKLLGRNSFETVAFLKQGDEAIRQQMKSHEEHARAVNESVQAAKQLQQTEAQLSQQLQTTLLPVFQAVVVIVQSVAAAIQYLGAIFESIGRVFMGIGLNIVTSLKGIGTVIQDVMSGNFTKAGIDSKAAASEIRDQFSLTADDITKSFTDAQAAVDKLFAIPAAEESHGSDNDVIADPEKAKSRVETWKEALQEMKLQEDAFHQDSAADDLAYWEKIKANNQLSARELKAVDGEILSLRKQSARETLQAKIDELNLEIAEDKKNLALKVQILKQEAEAIKAAYGEKSHQYREAVTKVLEAQQQENDEIARKLDEQKRKYQELGAAKAEAAKQAAQDALREQTAQLDFDVATWKITEAQKLRLLQQRENEAYAAERAALNGKIALYDQDTKEYANALKERDRLDAEHHARALGFQRQAALQQMQPWKTFFSDLSQNFKTTLNGWLQGTQSFTDGMKRMWQAAALAAIQSMQQTETFHKISTAIMAAISKIFHLGKIKDAVTSTESEAATAGATNTALATSAANLGAANAYAFWAWNPPVAAAMAAAALAAGLGFAAAAGASAVAGGAGAAGAGAAGGAAVGFAAQGALLGEDQLVFAHREEMILPPHISRPLQASLASGEGIGGGGGQTIHLTYAPQVSSVDGAHAHSVIERHAAQIGAIAAKTVRRQMKKLL